MVGRADIAANGSAAEEGGSRGRNFLRRTFALPAKHSKTIRPIIPSKAFSN
jgi:hypothetical protein